MSWITAIWKRESTKVLLKSALTILRTLAFGIGERLWAVTQKEVQLVAPLTIPGPEKAKLVWQALDREFKDLPGYIGNLAIELAVAHYKESQVKR